MKHLVVRFKGVPVLMTSNALPDIMTRPKFILDQYDNLYKEAINHHEAFTSRIKVFEMTKSHDKKELFPYNANDLAIYMLNYIENHEKETEMSFTSDMLETHHEMDSE